MTPERLKELRGIWKPSEPAMVGELHVNECLDAIERLKKELAEVGNYHHRALSNYEIEAKKREAVCEERDRLREEIERLRGVLEDVMMRTMKSTYLKPDDALLGIREIARKALEGE